MNIGQMMWWRPQGEIELYDGKYQGAVGPALQRHPQGLRPGSWPGTGCPGWHRPRTRRRSAHKFASLARASRTFRVPTAFAVPAAEFAAARIGAAARGMLGALFEEMRATVGAFFTEVTAGIEAAVADLAMPRGPARPAHRPAGRRVAAIRQGPSSRSAPRDSPRTAPAAAWPGSTSSLLGVRGADGVIAAVEECRRSHYARSAVAARVRAGDFDPEPRLAVFVQGWCVRGWPGWPSPGSTCLRRPWRSSTPRAWPRNWWRASRMPLRAASAVPGDVPDEPAAAPEVADACTRELRDLRGHDVDVEWAADAAGLHILQVRPVTARRSAAPAVVPGRHLVRAPLLRGPARRRAPRRGRRGLRRVHRQARPGATGWPGARPRGRRGLADRLLRAGLSDPEGRERLPATCWRRCAAPSACWTSATPCGRSSSPRTRCRTGSRGHRRRGGADTAAGRGGTGLRPRRTRPDLPPVRARTCWSSTPRTGCSP